MGIQTQLALKDISEGLQSWRIWLLLSWQDIKTQYQRSFLGPFWITLSMAITVYSMGFIYSYLFNTDIHSYFPLLTTGMICWGLISGTLIESTYSFIQADMYLKEMKTSYFIFIMRTVIRNLIVFLHNFIIFLPIIMIFHVPINEHTWLVIPALLIISINFVTYGGILAMTGTRYRDFSQVISSLIRVIFFITPVFWAPSRMGAHTKWVVSFNPFAQFLAILRQPLLGNIPATKTLIEVVIMTLFGLVLFFTQFKKYRAQVIYWL